MRMKLLTALLLSVSLADAQLPFWTDTFEDTGAPTSGTRTPETSSGSGDAYFLRTNGTGITTNSPYTNKESQKFWAGEDHDGLITGQPELQIDYTGINISGKSNIRFRGLFAANAGVAWESIAIGSSHDDYLIVEYSIDGGSYLPLLPFRPNNATNRQLALDDDNNGTGSGANLSYSFSEYQKSIPGTGNTLSIRVRVSANGGGEEWAIDNFRLFSSNPLPVNLTSFTCKTEGTANLLEWTTSNEKDNARFDVERSDNGISFYPIGQITSADGSGNDQQYSFADRNTFAGKSFYRLKQVDKNGDFIYSNIITSKRIQLTSTCLYPNPVVDKLNIVATHMTDNTTCELFEFNGRRVNLRPEKKQGGFVYDVSGLPGGLYFIKISDEGAVHTLSFFK